MVSVLNEVTMRRTPVQSSHGPELQYRTSRLSWTSYIDAGDQARFLYRKVYHPRQLGCDCANCRDRPGQPSNMDDTCPPPASGHRIALADPIISGTINPIYAVCRPRPVSR